MTDYTDTMANKGKLWIEIYHINTQKTVRFKAIMKAFSDTYNTSYDDHFFIGQTEPIKKWKSDYALKNAYKSISKFKTIDKTILPRVYGKPYWLNWGIKTKDIVISCNERCTLYEDGLYKQEKRKRKDNLHVESI